MTQYQSEPVPTARTEPEWRALLDSDDPRIIRNREDWDLAMADESRRGSILPDCDDETVQAFSDGLTFRNGGLAGADFTMLEDKLTYRALMNVWNSFGVGANLMTDYLHKKCDGLHNCDPVITATVCTSNC